MLFRLAAFVSYARNQSFFAPPESRFIAMPWLEFIAAPLDFLSLRCMQRARHIDKSGQLSFCLHSHFAIDARASQRGCSIFAWPFNGTTRQIQFAISESKLTNPIL
jgi:hypothetical protein